MEAQESRIGDDVQCPCNGSQPIFPAHIAPARSKLVPMDSPKLCRYYAQIAFSAIGHKEWDLVDTETVAEYEKVALFYLDKICDEWCELHSVYEDIPPEASELSRCFNAFGLYTFSSSLGKM
jgi:hypothetical protein